MKKIVFSSVYALLKENFSKLDFLKKKTEKVKSLTLHPL
jgi:hypothetical protein